MLFVVSLLQGLHPLLPTIAFLELVFIMLLEQGLVGILIELSHVLWTACSCAFLLSFAACKLALHLVPQIVVHDKLCLLCLLDQPSCRFLIGLFSVICLLQIRSCLHDRLKHLQVLVLDIEHADLAHVLLQH